MDLETEIRDLIARVNKTLGVYEKDYISCKRSSGTEKEVCQSFEQFVEIRFNREAERIPELMKAIEATQGHLFKCVSLEDSDIVKRKFKTATVALITPEEILEGLTEDLKAELTNIRDLLGGTTINFNSVKKKIKFNIE